MMLRFKEYLIESEDKEYADESSEQHAQNKIFGSQDYIPFIHNDNLKESIEEHPDNPKRLIVKGDSHQGKATGVIVPRHMWEGTKGVQAGEIRAGKVSKGSRPIKGMKDINAQRAEVYGSENRDPLTKGQIHEVHKSALEEHFSKPKAEQLKAEREARDRLVKSGHISKGAGTLDKSEKTDTVNFETDEKGRFYTAAAAKGVAGHALYTSGHGENEKHHVLNTCQGQTEGCGGGLSGDHKSAERIADTSKGTCFAPKAEAQYPNAAIRRACHAQAKHDPAMTKDWILAHTGSLRQFADRADKKNQRFVFRPNVVDETDTTSRLAIKHLNKQRQSESTAEKEKPPIIGYGYGKTGEVHDPKNEWHSTYSNTGPKVKDGKMISENRARDGGRISQTIMAATQTGEHHVNDEGEKIPPKNSYLVTNVKRGSPLDKDFQKNVTHAKYWSKGRETNKLTKEEQAQGEEGHYDSNGKLTTPEHSHYGHITLNGRRYDYQKQHILHPRMVRVPIKKDGKISYHDIPSDSRFKDDEHLPADRFKTKNGKNAGGILVTTPTESTSDIQHHSNFTHHVDQNTIEHAKRNRGEYEIDNPHEQEKALSGGEYSAPQPIQFDIKKPNPYLKK